MARFIKNIYWIRALTMWLASTCPTAAQITIQAGTLVSKDNSIISVNTPLVNYGEVVHQGVLTTDSDLLNYGSYDAAAGSLVLRGASQRILSDNLTVAELHIKGENVKTLEGRLEIKNSLYLKRGLLRVPETSQLILDEQTTINQDSEASYIWGSLCHQGNGNKFFPIGTRNEYAPLTLKNVQGDNPLIEVQYEPVNGLPYWTQTPLSGTYEGSPVTITFMSDNPDHRAYAQLLSVLAGSTSQKAETALESSLLYQEQSQFSLTSNQSTALPWISVGFANDEALEDIYIPNALSPEATNPEDRVIKVYGRYLSFNNFHFGIQDSWGRWLYQTTSLEEAMQTGWTTSDFDASPAQFRYVVSGRFLSGNSFQQSDIIVKF